MSKHNALITFLGKGYLIPGSNPPKFQYKTAKYKSTEVDFTHESPYFSETLIRLFNFREGSDTKINEIIVIGTDTSSWYAFFDFFKEHLDKENYNLEFLEKIEPLLENPSEEQLIEFSDFLKSLGIVFTPVIVPEGIYANDIEKIFQRITEMDLSQIEDLYFDITHGYRSLSFVISFFLDYILLKYPEVNIKDILYGSYESRYYFDDYSPIVSLKYLLDFKKMSRGAYLFLESGYPKALAEYAKSKGNDKFAERIDRYSLSYDMVYFRNFRQYASDVLNAFNNPEQIELPTEIQYLDETFREYLKKVFAHDVLSQLNLCREFFNKKLFSASIRLLFEAVISYIVDKVFGDNNWQDYKKRETVRDVMNRVLGNMSLETKDEKAISQVFHAFGSDFEILIANLKNIRNAAAHCGMRKAMYNGKPLNIEDIPRVVEELLQQVESYIILK